MHKCVSSIATAKMKQKEEEYEDRSMKYGRKENGYEEESPNQGLTCNEIFSLMLPWG